MKLQELKFQALVISHPSVNEWVTGKVDENFETCAYLRDMICSGYSNLKAGTSVVADVCNMNGKQLIFIGSW